MPLRQLAPALAAASLLATEVAYDSSVERASGGSDAGAGAGGGGVTIERGREEVGVAVVYDIAP